MQQVDTQYVTQMQVKLFTDISFTFRLHSFEMGFSSLFENKLHYMYNPESKAISWDFF